ncbi:hypothetical protein QQ045_005661 [Rhodiola kirilowii]
MVEREKRAVEIGKRKPCSCASSSSSKSAPRRPEIPTAVYALTAQRLRVRAPQPQCNHRPTNVGKPPDALIRPLKQPLLGFFWFVRYLIFTNTVCKTRATTCSVSLTTARTEALPVCYGLGFDSRTKKHKTLRIDVEEAIYTNAISNTVISARINTLGADTWEPIKSELPSVSIFGNPLVVEGGSALVWADFLQEAASKSRCVTVFNVSEEKFSRIALPQHIQVGHLVALKDRLCAVDLSSNLAIHIWMLEDLYADCTQWSSLCTIKMRATNGLNDHTTTKVLGELQNGEMLLKSDRDYFVYESETERFQYVHLPVARDPVSEVHCYAGSLPSAVELN